MGKKLFLLVAMATMAIALWVLLPRNTEPIMGGELPTPMAVEPEQDTPVSNLQDSVVLRPAEDSSPSRSAVEPSTAEAVKADPVATAPDPQQEHEHAGSLVEVLVVDIADKPIEGATVVPNEVAGGMSSLASFRNARGRGAVTNEQGLVSMAPNIEGLIRVVVTADGFAPGTSGAFEHDASASQKRVKVVLNTGGWAEGQLLDIHGEPASGISITIHLAKWPDTIGRSSTGVMRKTNTAEDGSFLFENLTPGVHTLYTRATGMRLESVPKQRVVVEIKEGEGTIVPFAQISKSFVKVHGLVIRNSEPLANASIGISWANRKRGYLGKKTKTDDDGRFTIILDEAANYRFQISPRGSGGAIFREVEIPSVERHEIEISFDTGSISGHLLGPNGEPIEGLEITAIGRSAEKGSFTTVQSTKSQADGTFEFLNLAGGRYELTAKTISIIPIPAATPKYPYFGSAEQKGLEVKAGGLLEGVELRMSAAAAVTGTVTDEAGKAVSGATVEFRGDSPMDNSQWKADESGTFLAGGLKPGHYLVRATRHKKLSAWVSVQAKAKTTTDLESMALQAGSLISIEAVRGGESAGRVHARIRAEDGFRTTSGILRDGKGQLGPILPGTYTVTVKPTGKGKKEASMTLIVSGEPSLEVRIELP